MKKNLLIIDDDVAILESLKICLEECGYEVKTMETVPPYVDFLDDNFPDLIILDFLLSGTDGGKIARKLKKNKKTNKIPIIMISAHPFARKACSGCGVEEFMSKPFELDELIQKIEALTPRALS